MTRSVLLDLAGKRYFERGEGYHSGGHVRGLVEHEGTIAAKVLGTHEYRVRLRAEVGLPSLHGLLAFKPRHLLSVEPLARPLLGSRPRTRECRAY